MQRRTRLFPILPIAIAVAAALPTVRAAELGDARVSSHIGQQLVADIELTLIEDARTPVQVRLADPEVYSGAGIAVPPALSTLNLSVMRRDGRQFLHATTLRPVDADHLHLYLELTDHGQRAVRLVTLWLTPDPHPAPAPMAVVPAPAPAVAPAVAVAQAASAHAAVPVPAPAPARARSAAETPAPARAAEPAAAHASASATTPASAPASAPASPSAAIRPPHAPLALPLPLRRAAAPAACVQQDAGVASCAALGAKNAELRNRIGQLEERVKGLQARLGSGASGEGAKPAAAAPAPAHAPAPAPAGHAAPKAEAHDAGAKPAAAAADAHADAHAAKPDAHPAQPPHGADHAAPSEAKPAEAKPEAQAKHQPEHQPEPQPEAKPEPKPAPPPGPKPISSIKPLVPHKAKTPPPDDDLPLGAIGAGLAVLAAVGGAAALLKARAKRSRSVGVPGKPGLLDKLRARFGKRAPAAPAPAARVEPVDAAVDNAVPATSPE